MIKPFRVIDTGIRDGRAQMAYDQALIDLRAEGAIPDTIRFLRFGPTVSLGRHQALSKEVKLDYCRANDIGIMRRVTGGGTLYLDEGQLGWELVFDRATLGGGLAEVTQAICEAAAAGISKLGVDARFRPRSDIEVDGRKICGSGGFFDGDTLFYQGILLVDMNPARMLAALNVPQAAKEKGAGDSAAQRVATLTQLLGAAPDMDAIKQAMVEGFAEGLGIAPQWGEITAAEEETARRLFDEEIGTDEFVEGLDDPGADAGVRSAEIATPGGRVAAHLRLEGAADDRFREVLITGDFFATPPRVVLDLEAALRGTQAAKARENVKAFFANAEVGLITVGPDQFADAIEAALAAG